MSWTAQRGCPRATSCTTTRSWMQTTKRWVLLLLVVQPAGVRTSAAALPLNLVCAVPCCTRSPRGSSPVQPREATAAAVGGGGDRSEAGATEEGAWRGRSNEGAAGVPRMRRRRQRAAVRGKAGQAVVLRGRRSLPHACTHTSCLWHRCLSLCSASHAASPAHAPPSARLSPR
mgnify:CR=1 FL=1